MDLNCSAQEPGISPVDARLSEKNLQQEWNKRSASLMTAHYFKRLTTMEVTVGDSGHYLARFIVHRVAVTAAD